MNMKHLVLKSSLIVVLGLLAMQPSLRAADVIKADNATDLNQGSSWAGGTPPTSADVAIWNSTVTAANTVLLGANTNWAGIRITNPADLVTIGAGNTLTNGSAGIDLGLAMADLTLDSGLELGASQTWNVGANRTLIISTPLSGAAATTITKSGAGTLILSSAANGTYAGNWSIDGGVLQLNSGNVNANSALGTGGITNNNSTLRTHAGRIVGNVLQFNGDCIVDANGLSVVFDGAIQGGGTIRVTNLIAGATLTFGGNGNGGGNMNNFTGAVLLGDSAGTLRFNNGGGNNNVGNANATFDLGTGTASFFSRNRNATVNFGELWGGLGTTIRQGASSSGTTTYNIGGKGTSSTFEGMIVDGGTTAAGLVAINKVGAGTLTLLGANTYLGNTTVSEGVLQIGSGGISGTPGGGAVVNNATLILNRTNDLTVANAISGTGNLIVQGGGTVTFDGANTSSGSLIVNVGVAVVGAAGSIQGPITLASGTRLDVSLNPGFALNQTLSGSGAVVGALTANGDTLSPGGADAAGALTFSNGLNEAGALIHQMELTNPGGPNDLINIVGDLTVSGSVTSSIVATRLGGGALPQGVYPLIKYSGTFNGTLDNFGVTVVGVTGTLTNPPNQIALIVTAASRGATNLTWKGDGAANSWDDGLSANWLSGLASFTFLAGDSVRFDATGAANAVVNLASAVLQPSAVVVDAANDYTFAGAGNISGATGLIKTNSGKLTIQTTNSYTGPTVIGGGTLEIASAANGNSASPLGASSGAPTNLVFYGSTLAFSGADSTTDRGATLNGPGGIFDIVSGNLTFNGAQLIGAGALVKNGVGTLMLAVANTYAGGTVLSNGVLALGSNGANNNGVGGSGLGPTNSPVTFRGGTLQLFGFTGSEAANYSTLYNPLVVSAGETGELRMFQRGPANSGGNAGLQSSLTGAGTLNLVVNYVRDDLSGDWSAFTGHINVLARDGGDEMRINNNFGYANATVTLNDGVSLCRSFTADTVNDLGALNGTGLSILGTGNSAGARTTWRVGWLNTDANFAGTIADDPGGTRIVKVGTGTWTLSGANAHTGPTIISNGVLAVTGSLASTNISVVSGAFLDVSALPALSLALGQTLGGNGTVRGAVDTSGGGTIAPGLSVGTLTITNSVNLAGEVVMEVSRSGGVLTSDKLIAPSIAQGGTLRVIRSGEPLQVNDIFDLFDGALSGAFTTLALGYYAWDTSQLAANGTIRVTGLLPAPTLGATASGADIVLTSAGGIPGGQLTVVTSTDASLPPDSWTPVVSDVFDLSGNYTLVIPVEPGTPQRFYAIRAF